MKIIATIFFVFVVIRLSAQTSALQKLWVGMGLTYMQGDNTGILRFENNAFDFRSTRRAFTYTLSGDTLHLHGNSIEENYSFLLDTLTKNKLTLTSLDEPTKRYFDYLNGASNSGKWIYHEIHQFYTDSIRFEKVVFKTSGGYHSTPVIIYELDKNGGVKIWGDKDLRHQIIANLPQDIVETINPSDRLEGYYKGFVSKEQLKRLVEILRSCEIDKLPTKGERNIDIIDHTMELHYNDKVKCFYGGFATFASGALIEYLSELPRKLELTASKTKFDIKFSSPQP